MPVFMLMQMQASVQASAADQTRMHEGTLHSATFKLTDFGRAAPYKDILAGLVPAGSSSSSSAGGDLSSSKALQRFNQDGVVVFSDPSYQPPEVCGGVLRGLWGSMHGVDVDNLLYAF